MHLDGHTPFPDPERQPEFYAGVPAKRLLAWVVDMLLIVLLSLLVVPFTAFTGIFFFPFLMLVVGFLYRVATLAGGSATWGMRLMAIEIRDARGLRLDVSTAFLHTLGYTVSIAVFPLQIVSIVLMLVSTYRQGLTDHVMGTVALNLRA
ncbi:MULTISPECIES: RDD family protein [unclassified Rhodosalinus]|uniref:RDD family protein n=1 Tax=unclassified Rhodosalinus TaxID=2630183 RepID=UPI0035266595